MTTDDDKAPITYLIAQIDNTISSTASTGAATLVSTITPIVSVCFGIYMIFICINYLRGAESDPVGDFILRFISWALIITFGLNSTYYVNYILPMVTGIGGDLANAITNGSANAGSLDTLALHYLKILSKGWEHAASVSSWHAIGAWAMYAAKAILIFLGLVPFLVGAIIALVLADVGAQITALLGPIYFAFLLFPPTRQYFSAWLNCVFSFTLMPALIAVLCLMSVNISEKLLSTSGTTTMDDISLSGVFFASIGNLVLLYLISEMKGLASALSAGGAVFSGGGFGSVARAGISTAGIANNLRGKAVTATKSSYRLGKAGINKLRGNSIKAG